MIKEENAHMGFTCQHNAVEKMLKTSLPQYEYAWIGPPGLNHGYDTVKTWRMQEYEIPDEFADVVDAIATYPEVASVPLPN